MDFARKQLEKYGWTDGKGLGKYENGISMPLKPKIKRSVTGVGHDPASEFTEHWWTKLYDKAADNVEVEEKHGKTKKIKIKDDKFKITCNMWQIQSQKSNDNTENEDGYSEYFIKKAILTCGGSKTERVRESDSESEGESEKKDVFKLTDEELFAACEGRTAHKGARHGLRALGKLARIERQEAALLIQPKYKGYYSHAEKMKKNKEILESTSTDNKNSNSDTDKIGKMKKHKHCIHSARESEEIGIQNSTGLDSSDVNEIVKDVVDNADENVKLTKKNSKKAKIKNKVANKEHNTDNTVVDKIKNVSDSGNNGIDCDKESNDKFFSKKKKNKLKSNCEDLSIETKEDCTMNYVNQKDVASRDKEAVIENYNTDEKSSKKKKKRKNNEVNSIDDENQTYVIKENNTDVDFENINIRKVKKSKKKINLENDNKNDEEIFIENVNMEISTTNSNDMVDVDNVDNYKKINKNKKSKRKNRDYNESSTGNKTEFQEFLTETIDYSEVVKKKKNKKSNRQSNV